MVGIFLYSTPLQQSAQHPPGCVFYLQSCFPAGAGTRGYSCPGAGLCIFHCWISWDSCQPISQPGPVPLNGSEATWCTSPSSALHPLQNCPGVTVWRYPGEEWRALLAPSVTLGAPRVTGLQLDFLLYITTLPEQVRLCCESLCFFERQHIFCKADDKWVSPFCTLTWQVVSQGSAINYSSVDISFASHQFKSNP